MKLSSCLSALALCIFGTSIGAAQPTVTTTASPWPVNKPLILTACGGPKTFNVTFYVGTSPSNVFGTPLATVSKPPGEAASYTWTPTSEGTFYLGAETDGQTYCGPNPGPITTQVIIGPPYYGFYDSSSPAFPDVTSTITSFANTAWINCSSVSDCASRLQEAQAYNMHVVVDFPSPCLLGSPNCPPITVATWETNWRNNWQSYVNTFMPYVNNGTIVAFYPYDEPFGGTWAAGNNASDTTSYLNFVAQTIKQTFSTTKVAMVFTGANTFTYLQHGQNVIPSSYDWIGIDLYECWSLCPNGGGGPITGSYTWFLQTLESHLYSGQRVILLPATAIYYGGTLAQFRALPSSNWSGYVSMVNNIFTLSETDNHVVGVFGFLYQNYYQGGSPTSPQVWVGASDPSMAAMLTAVTNFGKNVEKR